MDELIKHYKTQTALANFLNVKTGHIYYWKKYGIYVMVIGGLIGVGIVLWLLRPLFSLIGAFKGVSP